MSAHVLRQGPLCRAQYFEWWQSQRMAFRAHANVFIAVDLPSEVSPAAAEQATQLVLARHEILRTTFGIDESGVPQQRVHAADELPPVARATLADPSGRDQLVGQLGRHEFGPSEMPVTATIVLADDGRPDFLVVCCPHLVCDYQSLQLIRAEIVALLGSPGSPAPSTLPDCGPQPLDIAVEEARRGTSRSGEAAIRYWTKALSIAPARNFWRSYPANSELYRSRATSFASPMLLSRYAVEHDSTPSVVYMALVHMMMSLISGHQRTHVRFYFTGRSRALEKSVGPFHRELFSTVDLSERDSVSTCVETTGRVMMAARARYAMDHLAFREAEIREEAHRGSAFAWGTIANVLESPEFVTGWRQLASTTPSQGSNVFLPPEAIGPDVNERGMEVFLMTLIDTAFQGVQAEYNSLALSKDEAEILIRGPWEIVRDSLATGEDATVADLGQRYGLRAVRPVADTEAYARSLRDTETVLGRFPGVTASFLIVRQDRSPVQLLAYIAVERPGITAADLRDHVMASLTPMAAVMCPSYFVICGAPPTDRTSEASWQTTRRLSEGTGVREGRLVSHTEQEVSLLQAIGDVNDSQPSDLGKSYVESGGALLKVPAILQRLASAGFTGLHARDFESHLRLYQLARRLHCGGV